MSGWFAVKRGITSHPIFKGHPERLAIWLWLLDNAVWQDTPHDIRGKTVTVKRGSVCASERRIADEVGVGYQVVRTFLNRLKADQMINAEVTQGRTIITLCNYEKYQSAKITANAAANADLTQSQRTKEQVNKIPPTEGADAPVNSVVDLSSPTATVWAVGKAYLGKHKVKNPAGLIGGWLKTATPIDLLAAIQAADRAGTHDPVPYIQGVLKPKPRSGFARHDGPQIGDVREFGGVRKQYAGNGAGWVVLHA